ncbi:MAG: hypothetical protein HXY28_06055 [Hydrogenophilaceae bacterium]|jgi:hypothetical protein|nr:hypothetical protein [Hydrogenophilaceae bacterium]
MTARKVGGHVELDEEEARAGQTGVHLRQILILSLILALTGIGLASLLTG